MLKAIRNLIAPYKVIVCGWDEQGPVIHKAMTQADAIEWMKCYPNDVGISVFTRFNREVMFRAGI